MPEGITPQAPWEKFAAPAVGAKPWEQYAAPAAQQSDAPKPWEKFSQPDKPEFTERALPWQTPKPGQPQAQWNELPGALAEFGRNVWEGIKGAASVPGETYTEGLKGNLPGGLGGTGGPQDFEERAAGLAGLAAGGGKFPAPKVSMEGLKLVQKILSPQSVSPIAEEAAGSIRRAGGYAARDTATTAAQMEPWHATVNALPDAERLAFINHVEGAKGTPLHPKIAPLADTLKTEFQKRRTKLEALPSTQQAAFIEDYFPHFWKDPKAAKTFAENYSGGAGKQGSGASLKKRTMPTIADGIKAGLEPLTTDPIEAIMRYVSSMDRFIAATDVLDTAKANGTVKYIRPKTMGASGNPEGFKVPEGYAPLEGRGARDATGAQAYAPEDFARVYNNFISKGFHANVEAGKVYDAVQGASNAITSLELGLSGYHAFTMANEAIISDVARGLSNMVGGKPIKGVGQIVTAPAAFVRTAMRGHKAEQVYFGRSQGTPDMRKVVDLQTQAGGRAVGKGHAADYRFSAMGSYWTAFKRGALKQEMRQSLQNIKAQPLVGTAKEAGKFIGRVMETVAQPIFEKYIPKIKNGAFYDTMHDWLEANPGASHQEQIAMARKIWDSIDNRFGEMVQDNIFWNKTLKQTAQLGMRSYSWNLGTVREIGGGAISALKDPSRLSMKSPNYDPRVAYVVAMPIVVATANAVYQYLKSGKAPESVDDLVAGRTGGEAPGFGGRGTVDERASLPGYQKDVLGWYNDWRKERDAKWATLPRMLYEGIWSGKDWKGQDIANPNGDVPQWLSDYFNWVTSSLGPISLRQLGQGEKIGSNITTPEQLMGIRPAPGYIQDPEGTERGMKRIGQKQWKTKQRTERRRQSQYGGPQE